MMRPTLFRVAFAAAFLTILGASGHAAELVMVELRSCVYCKKFNREMAPNYEASQLGKEIPLRRVNQRKWPADLKQVDRPPYTPVFILIEGGRELGRFAGYAGPESFKKNLSLLLKQK